MEDFWEALILGLAGDEKDRGCAFVVMWLGFVMIVGLLVLLIYSS